MRLPAITPARRAQHRADVLARCISIAKTPEDAARFRRGYQTAAARAASMTSTDVPTGVQELVIGFFRRHRTFLLSLALVVVLEELVIHLLPVQVVTDLRWLVTGAAAYAVGNWACQRWFPGKATAQVWVYEEDDHDR
jgi:hypothetical protein